MVRPTNFIKEVPRGGEGTGGTGDVGAAVGSTGGTYFLVGCGVGGSTGAAVGTVEFGAIVGTVELGAIVGTVEFGAIVGTVEFGATVGTVELGAGVGTMVEFGEAVGTVSFFCAGADANETAKTRAVATIRDLFIAYFALVSKRGWKEKNREQQRYRTVGVSSVWADLLMTCSSLLGVGGPSGL
jgi:hypothetical protein